MKGIFGAMLLGLAVAFISSNREEWWILLGGILLLLGGVELLIADKISKLKDED